MTVDSDMIAVLRRPHLFGRLLGFDKLQEVHSCWIRRWVFATGDTALQAHRDSYKTTSIVIAVVMLLLLDPSVTVCILRRTFTDAAAVVDQIKNLLEKNEIIREFFRAFQGTRSLRSRDWSRRRFSISTRPSVRSIEGNVEVSVRSVEGNVEAAGLDLHTGAHYRIIFADDFVTWRSRYFPAERELVKKAIQELQNIKGAGKIHYVGTTWDAEDAWKVVPVTPRKYPLGRVRLPAFTPERIEYLKRSMRPSLFACNYLLAHEADEDLMFQNPKIGSTPAHARYVWGLDPAYDGACTTALAGLWKDPITGTIYAVARAWERNVSEVYDKILDFIVRYRPPGDYYTLLKVEVNADKGLSASALKSRIRERDMGFIQVSRVSASENKHARISVRLSRIWGNLVLDSRGFEAGTAEDPLDTSRGPLEQLTRYSEHSKPNDVPDAMSLIAGEVIDKPPSNYGGSEVYR